MSSRYREVSIFKIEIIMKRLNSGLIEKPSSRRTKRIAMSLPWIKLYCEILEDPKMGKMSEWLFCRCIKLFLIAGREGKDGMLPPVEDIAWGLRLDEDKTAQSLRDLAEVGVTHQTDDGSWWITNFSKRQALSGSAERTRKYRERLKQQAVTVTSPVTSPDSYLISSTSNSDSSLFFNGR